MSNIHNIYTSAIHFLESAYLFVSEAFISLIQRIQAVALEAFANLSAAFGFNPTRTADPEDLQDDEQRERHRHRQGAPLLIEFPQEDPVLRNILLNSQRPFSFSFSIPRSPSAPLCIEFPQERDEMPLGLPVKTPLAIPNAEELLKLLEQDVDEVENGEESSSPEETYSLPTKAKRKDSTLGSSVRTEEEDLDQEPVDTETFSKTLHQPEPPPPFVQDHPIPPVVLFGEQTPLHTLFSLKKSFYQMVGQEPELLQKVLDVTKQGGLLEQAAQKHFSFVHGSPQKINDRGGHFTLFWNANYLTVVQIVSLDGGEEFAIRFDIPAKPNLPHIGFSTDLYQDWKVGKFSTMFHYLRKSLNTFSKRESANPLIAAVIQSIEKGCVQAVHPTFENSRNNWRHFVSVIETACQAYLDNPNVYTVDDFDLLKAIVSSVYENPQLEFFKAIYPSILMTGEKHLKANAGLVPSIAALDKAKKKVGFPSLEKSKQSLGASVGAFEPLLDGRLPFYLKSFHLMGKEIRLYSMSSPTREVRGFFRGISISPLFGFWTHVIAKHHYYASLQSRQGFEVADDNYSYVAKKAIGIGASAVGVADESLRARAIEDCQSITCLTLPSDGEFYHQEGVDHEKLGHADVFKLQARNYFTDQTEGARTHFPIEWVSGTGQLEAFPKQVEAVIEMVHEVFFASKPVLEKEERKGFNEVTKAFLTLFAIARVNPDTMNFTCKDGIDRAGMHIALVSLLILIMEGRENESDALQDIVVALHAATFLAKGQPITPDSDRRARLLQCWKLLGFDTGENKVLKPEVIATLRNHRTFQHLMGVLRKSAP